MSGAIPTPGPTPTRGPRGASSQAGQPQAPVPTWRDPRVRGLLLLTVLLQALSWWSQGGYQLADSIEYVENAHALVRGHDVVDSHAIRSFVFPLILTPPIWLADMLGIEDQRFVYAILRMMQMGFGLGLVLATIRMGTRMHSARAGLIAGFAVAVNPVFLQYSVSPLTEIAAALGVALGLTSLAQNRTARTAFRAGLWIGFAMMIAYKTIMVAFAVGLVLLLRYRWKSRSVWGAYTGGLILCVLAQIVVDKLTYGQWGYSAWRYFSANFGPQFGALFWIPGGYLQEYGFEATGQAAQTVGKWFYDLYDQAADAGGAVLREGLVEGDKGRLYYLRSFHEMIVVPLLLLMAVGTFRALLQKGGRARLLVIVIGVYFAMTILKGSKDHRLYLPLVPVMASLVGLGAATIADRHRGRGALVGLLLAAGLVVGVVGLLGRNSRRYVGFWEAMERVNSWRALQHDEAPATRVASAYHWAVYLREAPGVVLTKLPHQLDGWSTLTPVERRENLLVLLQQDWFFAHLPVLTHPEHVDLMRVVGNEFAVETVLWNHADFQEVGPVLVLRRRTGAPGERLLHDRTDDVDPAAFARALDLGERAPFVHVPRGAGLSWLGFRYEPLPDSEVGWITTYTWCDAVSLDRDWNSVLRITTYDETNSFQRNAPLGWGVHPTSTWTRGTLVTEGFPVVAAAEPFGAGKPYRPMGGDYRRGDLMPVDLWTYFVDVQQGADGAPFVAAKMDRARVGSDTPIRTGELEGVREMPDGLRWSLEGLSRVGGFWLPVPTNARLEDDGRPVPADGR